MVKEKIDKLIMEAVKGGDAKSVTGKDIKIHESANLVNALKQIKVELVNAEKSGKAYNEIDVLKRLKKQHEDSIDAYKTNGRDELAANEMGELEVIKTFLPEEVGADIIEVEINVMCQEISKDHPLSMRDMGVVMSGLKKKYPAVDGKMASEIFKKIIS